MNFPRDIPCNRAKWNSPETMNALTFWLEASEPIKGREKGIIKIIRAPSRIKIIRDNPNSRHYEQETLLAIGQIAVIKHVSNRGNHHCYQIRAVTDSETGFDEQIAYCSEWCYKKRTGYVWTGQEIEYLKPPTNYTGLPSQHMSVVRARLRRKR